MKQCAALFLCVLGACGGGGTDDGLDEFVGAWVYEAGSTSKLDCDDNQFDRTANETGGFVVSEGTDSDLVVDKDDPDDPCPPLKMNVSDGVATAMAGQACTRTTNGTTIAFTDQMLRATIDRLGVMTISGSAKVVISGNVTTACTVAITAMATATAN